MNDVLKTIAGRRSVRQYREEQIKNAELHAILEAGLQAPSGHNDQSWYFAVVQNRERIDEINEGCKAGMRESNVEWIVDLGKKEKYNIFYNAPTVVIVAAKKDAISQVADVSTAIENMMIAAESLEIGSCWMGFARFYFSGPESYKRVGIPDGYEVFYGFTLGYKLAGLKLNSPQRKYEKYYHVIR